MEDSSRHARLRVGAQGRIVLPAGLRSVLGFEEGTTVVAYIEGEGRLVIESPEAIQRALLAEWSEVAGERSLVEELLAERRAAAVREAEEVEADLALARGDPTRDHPEPGRRWPAGRQRPPD